MVDVYQKYLKTSNLVDRLSSIYQTWFRRGLSISFFHSYQLLTSFIRLLEIQDELEKSIIRARDLNSLPKLPSDDPRGENSSLLHTSTSDLAQEIQGVSDENGLLQAIRPAQEKFREEGEEWNEGSEGESNAESARGSELETPVLIKWKGRFSEVIHIDQVMERAR